MQIKFWKNTTNRKHCKWKFGKKCNQQEDLNTNENKIEDMTNEVQVDEGVIARKRGHVATNKTLQLNLKGMQSTRTQILIEHGENHKRKLEEKSTKLKVQKKARKVLEIMSWSLC